MTKILLVEDDKSLREIYGVRLLAEGYDIVSAGDGEEALAMAIKERPGLIISDVMMPKISGFDMLDILRSTTETKDIKVIMMTALSSEDQRLRGETLGANRYLVKSQVGIEDVVRTVHEVLEDTPGTPPSSTQPYAAAPAPRTAAPAPTVPPRSEPAPVASAAPVIPTGVPAPVSQASTLPQPTAPFSTPRPANLGDRVIHPLEAPATSGPDVAARMEQELSGAPLPPTPTTNQAAGAVAYSDDAAFVPTGVSIPPQDSQAQTPPPTPPTA